MNFLRNIFLIGYIIDSIFDSRVLSLSRQEELRYSAAPFGPLSLTVGFEPDLDLFNFCFNGPSSTQGSFDGDIPYIYKLIVEK